MTSATVLNEYQERIAQLQLLLTAIQSKQGTTRTLLVTAIAIAIGLAFLALKRGAVPLWTSSISLPMVVVSLRLYGRQRLQEARLWRLKTLSERGADRLQHRWPGAGKSGEEFEAPDHLFASSLNLFGEGSLFERLCTARTNLGCERLADYLQQPASLDEIRRRQAAVRELATRADVRENIAALGRHEFQDAHGATFSRWLDSPSLEFPRWVRPGAIGTSVALAASSIAALLVPSLWPIFLPVVAALAGVHALVGLSLQAKVRRVMEDAAPVAGEMALVREALELLSAQEFTSPKLRELVQWVRPAGAAMREMNPWFAVMRERQKEWIYPLTIWLLLGTQSAIALEDWREQRGSEFRAWLDAWAEFETLNALACFAYENPEDCWPEVEATGAGFRAQELGHPLLAREMCVRNDVELGADHRFYLISGSNMAGKSTLLRSIGLAAVLTNCGAPVRARSLRLGVMRLCASISIVDSLREGKSKFLAEVQRLRDTLDAAADNPVLFLIDEIFSGTNSPDRQAAADAVIRTLVERGAIGAVSTHDVALSSLAAHRGLNVHMASREGSSDPLDFDYRLKPGMTRESNALAIARMAGVPV